MSNLTTVPAATRDSNGSAGFMGWTPVRPLTFIVHVSAVSGTSPQLAVHLEESYDGTTWFSTGSFLSTITATGDYRQILEDNQTPYPSAYRFRWEITGTSPSFTFSIDVYSQP